MNATNKPTRCCFAVLLFAVVSAASRADEPCRPILPEQRCLDIRRPGELCQVPVPVTPRPATVTDPQFDYPESYLTLNDTINITLTNSAVVRVLGGVTASTSGRTIYDAAITNTTIDGQRAAFDPNLRLNNVWNQTENAAAVFDPLDPTNAIIEGVQNEGYGLDNSTALPCTVGTGSKESHHPAIPSAAVRATLKIGRWASIFRCRWVCEPNAPRCGNVNC